MRAGREQSAIVALLAAGCAAALSACGSTKTVTVTNTVVKESTTTVTTTATDTTPTATTAATAPAPAPGSAPVLTGTYNLDQQSGSYCCGLPNNPHDGVLNADKTWTFMNGSCTTKSCQIDVRRLLSDSTIEDLTLFSDSPAGVYTGTIPGGDGQASCNNGLNASVKLTMIIRVGGLQSVNGQTVASRLAAHIFADYQCPGQGPTHIVATYVGTHA